MKTEHTQYTTRHACAPYLLALLARAIDKERERRTARMIAGLREPSPARLCRLTTWSERSCNLKQAKTGIPTAGEFPSVVAVVGFVGNLFLCDFNYSFGNAYSIDCGVSD